MSFATERQPRRKFLGILGVGMGGLGFLAGASALEAGGGSHNLLSVTHPDTLPDAPLRGAFVMGNSTPVWSRLLIGGSQSVIAMEVQGLEPEWSIHQMAFNTFGIPNVVGHDDFIADTPLQGDGIFYRENVARWESRPDILNMNTSDETDVSIVATGDSQAKMSIVFENNAASKAVADWYYVFTGGANAVISIQGQIHRQLGITHTTIGTFKILQAATGAGDAFHYSGIIRGLDHVSPAGGPGTREYHLNFTTVTLNGGSFVIENRTLWRWH